MFKYLPGILIVQAATVAMTLAALKSGDQEIWLSIGLLALIISVVTAFWFASIARHIKKDALAQARDEFSKERENLRVNAERQKTKVIQKSQEHIRKETNRVHAKTSFKLGAGFIGIIGAGTLMIFTQFLTLGLLTLAVGVGALGGYLTGARRDVLMRRKEMTSIQDKSKTAIEGQSVKDDSAD